MNFIRQHIKIINKTITGAFIASWFIIVLVVPFQVAALADSHTIFSVYNAEEGCLELVMDHHNNSDENHFSDIEEHDLHSVHSSCCYAEYVVNLKKQDIIHTLAFELSTTGFWVISYQTKVTNPHNSDYELPPPVTHDTIHVTRLLI